MAWRKASEDPFPAPLREFRESEWPQLPGECLSGYSCHGEGYRAPCVPRPGEFCGQRTYEMLARDHPDDPGMLARWRAADAYERFHRARLNWLGDDHPGWLEEFVEGGGIEHQIRYGWSHGAPPG